MPLTVLIVDDEPLARAGLRLLLAEDPEIAAIHEAKDGLEAVALLRGTRPDLVFLDVQMPEMDGLAVVREMGAEAMPVVVFVTAHDRYALQAFEVNALDYLLKPFTRERFAQALARAKARLGSQPAQPANDASRQILSLLETLAAPRSGMKRLAVRSGARTAFVELDDVDWIEAAENYVRLHAGQTSHLAHVAMNTLEKSLDPATFLRIHRSIIVNVGRIRELEPSAHGEYVVTLANGVRVRSGRTYHERLKALASNPF
jgi:two-component system LytT family response regulator